VDAPRTSGCFADLWGGAFRMIITSNRAFPEWPEVFGEPLLASAAPDRLAHDAHQIAITGESYRTRATRKRSAERKGGNEARADA
jgi:hypothetical protein